jgi:hypothetical protein
MRNGQNDDEPIEISPAPALYLVEFTLGRQPNERISILLPATCGLAAMTGAWTLFPEYKRDAKRTSVHPIRYAELDWRTARIIIAKQKARPDNPIFNAEEPNKRRRKKKNDVESGE